MSQCASPARYCYSLYGVRINSDFPFEFPAGSDADGTAAPIARVDFVHAVDSDFAGFLSPSDEDESRDCQSSPGGPTYIRWPDWYEFSISADGSRIACRSTNACDTAVLQNFVFGQTLALALVHQGLEPLHASVVQVGDNAIGFLGDCAFGKSTLLAAFLEMGHLALTDDMLVVARDAAGVCVLPGSGRIKLQPDSARRFLDSADNGTPLTPLTTKRSFPIDAARRQNTRVPLRQLFILPHPDDPQGSSDIDIRPVSRAEMARALVKNTFTDGILSRDRVARQFAHAVDIASEVDGFRLRYPRGLQHLEAVRSAIAEHVLHGESI